MASCCPETRGKSTQICGVVAYLGTICVTFAAGPIWATTFGEYLGQTPWRETRRAGQGDAKAVGIGIASLAKLQVQGARQRRHLHLFENSGLGATDALCAGPQATVACLSLYRGAFRANAIFLRNRSAQV